MLLKKMQTGFWLKEQNEQNKKRPLAGNETSVNNYVTIPPLVLFLNLN